MGQNFEIVAISNKSKNFLNDFIDSLDPECLDWAKLIDKKSYNAFRSEGSLVGLSKGDYLDKNVLDQSFRLVSKIRDLQMYQCYIIVS